MLRFVLVLALSLVLAGTTVLAQDSGTWSEDQRAVLASMDRLSSAMGPEGLGVAAYGAVLHKDFSRWTSGSTLLNSKTAWLKGLTEWFGDGWRVVDRNQVVVGITIKDDYAFSRRIVEETYLGPEGETTRSKSALVETWVYSKDAWLLLQVNVDLLEVPAPPDPPAQDPQPDIEASVQPTIVLPPPLARVLTDYEAAWQARDAKALADLFTEDGFVLSSGRPAARGRAEIEQRYQGSGGPLALRAWAYSVEGSVGTIIGGYARKAGEPDLGKFTLTLKKTPSGSWMIMSDMDNGN